MPQPVKTFAFLFYASIILQFLAMYFGLYGDLAVGPRDRAASAWDYIFTAILFALFVGAPALLTWLAASKRQNWARILLAVGFGLGVLSALFPIGTNIFTRSALLIAQFVIGTGLQAAGLYFVFSPGAHPWFVQPSKPNDVRQ